MNKKIKEMATNICEELTDCQKMRGLDFCSGCELQDEDGECGIGEHIAESLYNADYRKIDQTYEQLQEENNRINNAYDLILKQLKCFKDEYERLYKMKRDLEDYIIEQGWQEYVGEENKKTVWHKVADGDLPKDKRDIILCFELGDQIRSTATGYYDICVSNFVVYDFGAVRNQNVIAWTELPTYKGEE